MCLNGGELDGARLVSPKTLQLMTRNHLPDKKELPQFRARCSASQLQRRRLRVGLCGDCRSATHSHSRSNGEYTWGGLASTLFWIDPLEQLIGIFLTQLIPSSTYSVRREVRTLTYAP